MSEVREVSQCGHRFMQDCKCFKCGAYNHRNQAVKTNKFATPFHFNFKQYQRSLRNSSCQAVEGKQLGEDAYLLLASLCDKFLFSNETLALGIYIYQCLHKLNSNQKFWASACLIVAGKSGELDKNVPYLNRYQRYADKCFSQSDYEQAERNIFQSMNFEVQHSTFITFLDFYLTCGVLFTSDNLNETLVEFFEDDIAQKAKQFLKKGAFTAYAPQNLALSIIKETRLKYNLPGWTEELQKISGFTCEDILVITTTQSPLQELNHNSAQRFLDLKGLHPRKKCENGVNAGNKATLQKYTSISRSTTFKENSYSTSKLLAQGNNSRKPSHFVLTEGLSALNSQLLNRRR